MKLFNKVRQTLLTKNKLGPYLIYAVGEIILVVIGILIALSLDQMRQKNEEKEKVKAIFEVILEDLVSDINESSQLINTIYYLDTLSYQVLHNKINAENFQEANISFYELITLYNIFSFTEKGYNNLSRNIDIFPKEYNAVIQGLDHQNIYLKENLKSWYDYTLMLANKHSDYFVRTYKWYANNELQAADVNELLNDFRYKNFLKQYQEANIGWLIAISDYRSHSINNYQHLAMILNKPAVHKSFQIDEQIAKLFTGKWKVLNNTKSSNQTLIYSFENGRLFLKNNDIDEEKREVFILSNKVSGTKSIVQSLVTNHLTTHVFEGDTLSSMLYGEENKAIRVK